MHRTDRADIEPKPEHRIPLWLGTFGDRALAMTGRVADGWLPSLGHVPAGTLPAMRDRVLAGAAAAGRDPAELTLALNVSVHLGPGGDADLSGDPAEVVDHLPGADRAGLHRVLAAGAPGPVGAAGRRGSAGRTVGVITPKLT